MQFYKVVDQWQTDARTDGVHLSVVAIEESVEEMLHLILRDADTGIWYDDGSLLSGDGYVERNLTTLFRILHGVV